MRVVVMRISCAVLGWFKMLLELKEMHRCTGGMRTALKREDEMNIRIFNVLVRTTWMGFLKMPWSGYCIIVTLLMMSRLYISFFISQVQHPKNKKPDWRRWRNLFFGKRIFFLVVVVYEERHVGGTIKCRELIEWNLSWGSQSVMIVQYLITV